MKVSKFALATVASLLVSGSVSAGTIVADYKGQGFKSNVQVSVRATVGGSVINGNGNGATYSAGEMKWEKLAGSTHPGNPPAKKFTTFCIELLETVVDPTTFTVADLATAPNPGTPTPGATGMGATKAADIKKLWASYRSAVVNNVTGAAFQLAIWEIVYEKSGTYDVTSGALTSTSNDTTQASIRAQANTWLSNLGTAQAKLAAFTGGDNVTAQDQVGEVAVVPLPTAAWMGLGLLASAAGVSYARRRSIMA